MSKVLKVIINEKAKKILVRESARSRTLALAKKFDGKPLEQFQKAWEKNSFEIHGEKSKFTERGKAQSFKGWYSFFERNGIFKVS